ncbi:MAG: TolC family protein [Lutibacter sp.]|uniref:TolC family protein n=1 Tax=Lutibacter sp. TaxID=1925666 RepID=UPI00183F6A60|nr:TolC family protein [Lutibacter sp.]MBT8317201.1 TolC family protein [Lutibacter sp.]NNJ58060.1 TolC family protein [Lutibacter sp.]
MRIKNSLLILFSLFNILIINAQNEKLISLEEVITKVRENNHTIKISEQDFNAAKADFNQTNSILLPNISVSHSAISTTNPLMAFGSKLNQEILTQFDFNPDLLNDPDEIQNFATKIEIQQPIFNADGLYMRKAAKAKMNAFELQTERTTDYIELEVQKAYMQLQIAYKAVEVLEKAKEAALENKKIADNNFKNGYMQKADILSVEVHVTEVENQLITIKSNVKNASDYLQFLMGETSAELLKPSTKLEALVNTGIYDDELSSNRADIEAMEKSTEAYSNMHKANKMSYLPRLNAFGSYELYDDKLFGTNAKGYLVGAQLSWNVFEGFKRVGKTQKSKAELDKAELSLDQYKNQSELEFSKAKRQLKDAENKLKLTQLAVDQSNEALRIRTNRFEQGLEKTSDLLISETQYLQKQLEYLQTVFNYNFTKAYVEFLSK